MLTVRCPYCRENDDKVVDSRTGEDGAAIRRRRECLACGRRFTTYERLDEHGLVVRKRDDTREPFDRDKLRDGLERAGVRPARTEHALDALATEIEEQLRAEGGEIGSDRIGVTVLEQLRGLDHVAYSAVRVGVQGFRGSRGLRTRSGRAPEDDRTEATSPQLIAAWCAHGVCTSRANRAITGVFDAAITGAT